MTLKERVIVEVYTGACMVVGEERGEVYKYMENIMGRPVFTHELARKEIQEELEERSKDDFVNLCKPPHINADRIRAMSDEELADFLKRYMSCGFCDARDRTNGCKDCEELLLQWLKSEVKE